MSRIGVEGQVNFQLYSSWKVFVRVTCKTSGSMSENFTNVQFLPYLQCLSGVLCLHSLLWLHQLSIRLCLFHLGFQLNLNKGVCNTYYFFNVSCIINIISPLSFIILCVRSLSLVVRQYYQRFAFIFSPFKERSDLEFIEHLYFAFVFYLIL